MTSQSQSSPPPRILIVDHDPVACESLSVVLRGRGNDVSTALDGAEALDLLARAERSTGTQPPKPFSLVISDLNLPGTKAHDLLVQIRKRFPDTVVLVLTAYGTIEAAVEAIKLGALDYLTHPLVEEEFLLLVEKALRQAALLAQNASLKKQLDTTYGLGNIIGADPRMQRIYELVQAVAPTRTTVLMTGESGTGKSLVARAIHQRSPVRDKPFIEISCGSIPETLLESELFGHVKGAFTGAHADKVGRFLAADGGTIFLDEINSASPGMQLKLLRVLQEKEFEPVGSTQTVKIDVRVVLASNQPLEQLVAQERFRQDLYYRINVVKIELPPLRDRIRDIPILTEHFLAKHSKAIGRDVVGLSDQAMEALRRYSFPGNVRELENIIERAVVLAHKPIVSIDELPTGVIDPDESPAGQRPGSAPTHADDDALTRRTLADALIEHEKRVILAALNANNWNRNKTASQLGINRTTLYKKIKAYNLERYAQAG